MKLGSLDFPVPVFLAPMAGITDVPFAILAHEMGCPLVFSEMVSVMGIKYRNEKTLSMLRFPVEARPVALQLFGASPELVAEAAALVESLGCADVIDFNMGCPAPKIVKGGAGAALLREPELAARIIGALRRATRLPVTVKMRTGWDAASVNAAEMARRLEAAGADAITVHGRTREDYYRGRADWGRIAEVKRTVSIPVIANGDIRTTRDLSRVMEETGCDAVMIGRAADGNPWIFRAFARFLATGEESPAPSPDERADVLMRHLDMLIRLKGEYIGVREMRRHAMAYTKGLANSAALRESFSRAAVRDDFSKILGKKRDSVKNFV